ncbi:unnamed protein product [Prorocentrum cordatum]|uniref:Uncharacterized protein n=1 Tax=Prorocentrum cordatum TaxID=2364126 RepID=A0ABN9UYU0_9DINO|nr:unnamed protein product [Polarella glacialis]
MQLGETVGKKTQTSDVHNLMIKSHLDSDTREKVSKMLVVAHNPHYTSVADAHEVDLGVGAMQALVALAESKGDKEMADKHRAAIQAKSQSATTALSKNELRSMVKMAEKSGDVQTAKKYKQLLDQLDKGSEQPAQLRANKAHAKVRNLKSKLEADNVVLQDLLAQVDKQRMLVAELVTELESADADYKEAVAEAAAGVGAPGKAAAAEAGGPPKLSLAKLMDGDLDDLDLDDDGLFGYAEFEELGPEALAEAKRRKKQMPEPFRQMAGSFFGQVRQKGEALQAEHKALQERLAAKKRRTADDEESMGEPAPAAAGQPGQPAPSEGAGAPPAGQPGTAGGAGDSEQLKAEARAAVAAASANGASKGVAAAAAGWWAVEACEKQCHFFYVGYVSGGFCVDCYPFECVAMYFYQCLRGRQHGERLANFVFGAPVDHAESSEPDSDFGAPPEPPDPSGSGLRVETCNATCWNSFKEWLSNTTARIICLQGIQGASIVQVAQLSPHKPVHLQLHPRLSQLCALTFRKPPPIPKERPTGVGRAPPDRSRVQNVAVGCLGTAITGNLSETQGMLDWAYGLWADLAEQELCGLAQETLPFYGARSKSPQLHWVPIIKDKAPPFRHPKLFAGKWVSHRFQAEWLEAAQDVLSLVQKYVVKLQGVVAGCSMATTVVRVYILGPMSNIRLPRGVFLAQFIDGSGLDSTGKAQDVLFGIKEGSRQLEHALVHECGCSISLSKAGQGNLVCSDGSVARELQFFFGDRTGPLCDSVVDLGIEFAAGRSRRKAYIKKALRESKLKIRTVNLKAKARKAWCIFFQKKPPSTWREVTGPFSTMYMCLQRIQWKFIDWATLENDFGEKLVFYFNLQEATWEDPGSDLSIEYWKQSLSASSGEFYHNGKNTIVLHAPIAPTTHRLTGIHRQLRILNMLRFPRYFQESNDVLQCLDELMMTEASQARTGANDPAVVTQAAFEEVANYLRTSTAYILRGIPTPFATADIQESIARSMILVLQLNNLLASYRASGKASTATGPRTQISRIDCAIADHGLDPRHRILGAETGAGDDAARALLRKLETLSYPELDSAGLQGESYCKIVLWLEEEKIRLYTPAQRKTLRDFNDAWYGHVATYARELGVQADGPLCFLCWQLFGLIGFVVLSMKVS